MSTIQLTKEHGYILAAATSTILVNAYHVILVSGARKASGIGYPTPYATKEHADKDSKAYNFNVAQRAHANFSENLPPFLVVLGIASLNYPTHAAYLGWGWVASRVVYAFGYTTYGPPGRSIGFLTSQVGTLALLYYAGMTCLNVINQA